MWRHGLAIWILLVSILLYPFKAFCANPLEHSLFIIFVPGLKLEDLKNYPTLHWLSENSAIGLMNTSTGGVRRISSSYLTLAAGVKIVCPEKAGSMGLQRTETIDGLSARELYRRYLAVPAGDYEVLNPYYHSVLAAAGTSIRSGLLADTWIELDIPFIFIGNHDMPGTVSRPGALFAANIQGKIKTGFVDEQTYQISTYSPTYFTTNYPFYYEKITDFLNTKNNTKNGIVILDCADLARLDSLYGTIPENVYQQNRTKLLTELDEFLGELFTPAKINNFDILLITPFPDISSAQAGNTLTPIICHTTSLDGGLIISSSTKRPGLLTNLDLAPTVLSLAGIKKPPVLVGSAIQYFPSENPYSYLEKLHQDILTNYQQRPPLLKSYVILQIIVVLSVIALILLRHPFLPRTGSLLLVLTAGPLLFLLLPLFPFDTIYSRITGLLVGTTVILYLLNRKTWAIKLLTLLYLLTTFTIACDILLGAPLMKSSLLGYDAISGARYYGIGNEYMGVLLGSSIIGFSLLLETLASKFPQYLRVSSAIIFVLLLLLILLVAAPQWGTNVGGALSFTGSYLLFGTLLVKDKVSIRTLVSIGVCSVFVLFALFWADMQRPLEVQSHIGLTARLIQEEGIMSLWPIFARKISMNIKLLQYSLWTRVFLTFLGATALTFYRPPGLLRKIFLDHPFLKAGFIAGLSGSFIALVVNDSGIVAAATSSIFVVPTLLYLIIERTP